MNSCCVATQLLFLLRDRMKDNSIEVIENLNLLQCCGVVVILLVFAAARCKYF